MAQSAEALAKRISKHFGLQEPNLLPSIIRTDRRETALACAEELEKNAPRPVRGEYSNGRCTQHRMTVETLRQFAERLGRGEEA